MNLDDGLRRPGRAGGVEEVGHVGRGDRTVEVRRVAALEVVDDEYGNLPSGKLDCGLGMFPTGQECAGPRMAEHPGDSCGGLSRIEGNVRSSRLEHSQDAFEHPRVLSQVERDAFRTRRERGVESARHAVRECVELGIGPLAAGRADGEALASFPGDGLEA